MTTLHSLTAGRRRLRNALRRARDEVGMTQEHVAEKMEWSLSKLIRIETGAVSISTNDLKQLLQLYRIEDPERVSDLLTLARSSRERPWWLRYRDTVPAPYLTYIGLEDASSGLRYFYPYSMPGLLQTEEFAHAIVDAVMASGHPRGVDFDGYRLAPHEAAQRVSLKLARQQKVLQRENPPEITAILDEGVLHRQIGGPRILRDQLRYLIELSRRPHITIRVLPFTAHLVSVLSPFAILEFPDPEDPDAVYVESALELGVLDQVDEVAVYRYGFEQLAAAALPEDQSLELIARVAHGLG